MSKSLELFETPIIQIKEITSNHFVIDLEYHHQYIAGQVVALTTSVDVEPRLYSIAGSFGANSIRILFDVHQDGMVTPVLATLTKGSMLKVSKPFGRFIGTNEPAWWIATGTGVAPYISMCQQLTIENKKLIHGARTLTGFLFNDFFKERLGNNYVRCCTSEMGEGIYPNRLTVWLKEQTNLPLDINTTFAEILRWWLRYAIFL